jgi:hypothetical protein
VAATALGTILHACRVSISSVFVFFRRIRCCLVSESSCLSSRSYAGAALRVEVLAHAEPWSIRPRSDSTDYRRNLAKRVPGALIDVAVLLSSHQAENAQMPRAGRVAHSNHRAQGRAE